MYSVFTVFIHFLWLLYSSQQCSSTHNEMSFYPGFWHSLTSSSVLSSRQVWVWRRTGRMVVQPLRHERHCERIPNARRLLQLRPFVLEPDFHLSVREVQLAGELRASLLRQVTTLVKLALEPLQLLGSEGDAGAFFGGCGGDYLCRWSQ